MTVTPDAKLDHGVDARVYNQTVAIADAEIEEGNRFDYRYRERDEKENKGGEKRSKDRKKSGQHGGMYGGGIGTRGMYTESLSRPALCSPHPW